MAVIVIALIAALALALVIFSYLKRQKAKKPWPDIDIPMPETLRTDLHNVYYMGTEGQLDEYGDHVSLFWFAQWFSTEKLAEMLARFPSINLVLDVAPQVLPVRWKDKEGGTRLKPVCSSEAPEELRKLFNKLRELQILNRVKYIVPMDEPNLFCQSEDDLVNAVHAIKQVCREYPELANVKHTCIYGGDGKSDPFWALSEFDIVGIDCYQQRSGVLLDKGAHGILRGMLYPDQRTMIIPGPAYGQKPEPFVAYAHSHPEEVEMVVPFIWTHVEASASKEWWVGLEKRTQAERDTWRKAGLQILNRPMP